MKTTLAEVVTLAAAALSCQYSVPLRAGIDADAAIYSRIDLASRTWLVISDGCGMLFVEDTSHNVRVLECEFEPGIVLLVELAGERRKWKWNMGDPIPEDAIPVLDRFSPDEVLELLGLLQTNNSEILQDSP